MHTSTVMLRAFVVCTVAGVAAFGLCGSTAMAQDCQHSGIKCPMVWDPVICNDGEVYSNSCYAYAACAIGCVPYDDDGILYASGAESEACPPKPKFCPKLWAPVICDDGKVYPNDCWAAKHCATNCEPYGDWLLAGGGPDDRCPPKPKFCPQLWAPVICDNGKVYPNQCWADKHCATGCVPYEELLAAESARRKDVRIDEDDGCPRIGYPCPDDYDPVLCDDGEIYANLCVAWVWCATGCQALRE